MNINEPAPTGALSLPFTRAAKTDAVFSRSELRLPLIRGLPDNVRNHFIAMCGEFVGTVLFLYFALSGAQVANSIRSSAGLTVQETGANPQQLQYIALSFGFSLAVNAWVFFRISGGLFNPAVTIGMCLIGALPWVRGVLLFFVQILGGLAAAGLVSCMFPGELNVQTSLGGGTSVVQGLFIEMMLTAQLVFTIFMLAAEKHKGTFIAPMGIGLSLFVAEMTGVYFTGGSLNPARSFGPAAVNRNFEGYHWIYWLGPLLGALLSAGFFKFIKMLEYETANPDQDAQESPAHADPRFDHTYAGGSDTVATSPEHTMAAEKFEGTSAAGRGGAYATGAAVNGYAADGARPPMTGRLSSQARVAVDSPAPGTADDAFHGLAHGMHGTEDQLGSRVRRPSGMERRRPSGMGRTPSGIV